MASRHELRARHTEEKQKQNPQQRLKRNMAVAALVGVTAAAAIGVFAGTYYIDNGDITIDGDQITYYEDDKTTQKTETDTDITITQHEDVEVTDNTITIIADENETVEVTIRDINIEATEKIDPDAGTTKDNCEAAISIEGAGDVVLELDGDNVVKSSDNHAGVETAGSGMLIIQDENEDGSLDATGGSMSAGIGGGSHKSANITINGGNIAATGGLGGAGIGGGWSGTGNVTINDGKIEAAGGNKETEANLGGAGIGGGYYGDGNVIINGGEVDAIGGGMASGIGGAFLGSGNVVINEGKVNATAVGDCGDGIGGDRAIITINGGTISTAANKNGAGIGGLNATVTITGGTIDAVGGLDSAGIGTRVDGHGTVTIVGGTVSATAGDKSEDDENFRYTHPNAIGSGGKIFEYNEKDGTWIQSKRKTTVTINDSTVVEQIYGWDANGHTHAWKVSEYTAPTYEAKGVEISLCECGSKKTEFLTTLVSEKYLPLTVTTLLSTAQPYEQTVADGRAVFAAPAQDAILTGSLGALAELKAQGVQTLMFRTQLCETSVSLDKILAAGSEDDVFTLTHKGTEAVLTVAGRVVE